MRRTVLFIPAICLCGAAAGYAEVTTQPAGKPATAAEARAFVEEAETTLLKLWIDSGRADWVRATHITEDTETLAAQANEKAISAAVAYAKKATRFDGLKLSDDVARKLTLLKLSLTLAAPADPKEAAEVTRIAASMEGVYGKGKYKPEGASEPLDLEALSKILAKSHDPKELADVWRGWHAIAPPIKKDFIRYVELANKGARELGFPDTGAMWRSKYDMPPDAFAKEVDRLWEQLKPLYVSLHAYVRWKLKERYGDAVPASGPIPAHLLGNMWAQDWENIYPLVAPKESRSRLRPLRDPEVPQDRRPPDGALRRGLLHVARLRSSAGDVLGAVDVRQAARPRGRLPRFGLGHRLRRRPAHQDVHRHHGRGLHDDPPRARPQLLSARL